MTQRHPNALRYYSTRKDAVTDGPAEYTPPGSARTHTTEWIKAHLQRMDRPDRQAAPITGGTTTEPT
ncbi:hypothetical protein [Rhodococcus koreensis]|nr:hypothetical protein [Rhodococcus sp. T2V]